MRDAYFDNAKVLLIFLVVFGHVLQPYTSESTVYDTLYMWVYTFHMPAFIFLSGFFAKGFGNRTYITKLLKKLILPYIMFQLMYTGYYFLLGKSGWQSGIFDPQWSLWFLFSLFSWHILLIIFKKLPPIIGMLITVEIGLLVGYIGDIGHTFSLSRTFVFFPFFLLGYWLKKDHIMRLKTTPLKVASIVVMAAVAIGIWVAPEFNSGWLLASKSYDTLGYQAYGGLGRLIVYATSFLMSASILAWVPRKDLHVTSLGVWTLYIYLLHGFVIQFLRQADVAIDVFGGPLDMLVFTGVSAILMYGLTRKPVRILTQPLIEGRMSDLKQLLTSQQSNTDNMKHVS